MTETDDHVCIEIHANGMCKACYNRQRRVAIAAGQWRPTAFTEASEIRDHLQKLAAKNITTRQAAELAGVPLSTLRRVNRGGSQQVRVEIADAVLAIKIPTRALKPKPRKPVHRALVPILGSQRRMQALIAAGYEPRFLARELGVNSNGWVIRVMMGTKSATETKARTARKIRALYERLKDTEGPSPRWQRHGTKHGWPTPDRWTAKTIDDPDAEPLPSAPATMPEDGLCPCGCGQPGDFSRGMCRAAFGRFVTREKAYGRWQPFVDAEASRARLHDLCAAGLSYRHIADLTRLDRNTLVKIAEPGSQRVRTEVEAALLSLEVPEHASEYYPLLSDSVRVPIIGAQRRIQALTAFGHPRLELAVAMGTQPEARLMCALLGEQIYDRGVTMISARAWRAVKAVYDTRQMKAGSSDRARKRGEEQQWPLPFEWDDENIDDPAAEPIRSRWTEQSARDERRAKVHALTRAGMSAAEIAERLDVDKRTIERDRAWLEEPGNFAKIDAA